MNIRNTTLLLLLLFVCQQAGAVVSGFQVAQNTPSDSQFTTGCHDLATDSNIQLIADTNSTVETASAMECCDIECQCCVGGCSSALISSFSGTSNPPSDHPNDRYQFVLPQTQASSLFRPPIYS